MPIYVYETIPGTAGVKPTYFEIRQGMTDKPLTRHPETGEEIRRVILGGFGILRSGGGGQSRGGDKSGCCGSGCGCG